MRMIGVAVAGIFAAFLTGAANAQVPRPCVWYPDCDHDGFGDEARPVTSCSQPNGEGVGCDFLRKGRDCNDHDPSVFPGAREGKLFPETTSDGVDNDCDGYVDIDCDGTSGVAFPSVEIETPLRGSFLTETRVEVSGSVLPSQRHVPIASVRVGSALARLTPCSREGGVRFSAEVEVAEGLSTIPVSAQDRLRRTDVAHVSLISATRFTDLATETLHDSIHVLVNQGSWDLLADDLEGLVTPEAVEAELLSQNPIVHESGDADCLERWEIYGNATAYTHTSFDLSFSVTGGRIYSTARLVQPRLWVDGWGFYDLEWYCGGFSDRVGLTGYASFTDVTATADGHLSIDANGDLAATFTNVLVQANGAYVNVDADNSFYDWLIDLFEDDLAAEMEAFIEAEIRDFIRYDLGPALSEALNDLDLSYEISVSGVPYEVMVDYDSLTIPEGTVSVGFSIDTAYPVDERVPENPGVATMPADYRFDTAPTFGFKISDNFFNAALFALWEGGIFHLEDEPLWSDPEITGSTDPRLPPMVAAGNPPFLLELRVGDLIGTFRIVEADGSIFTFEAAISALLPLDLDPIADGETIRFDATFGKSTITYDLLGIDSLPEEVEAASEAAMAELIDLQMADVEAYLESLEFSYLDLPVILTNLSITPDAFNAHVLSLTGDAILR